MIIVLTYPLQFLWFVLVLACTDGTWSALSAGHPFLSVLWIAAMILAAVAYRETGRLRDWLAERDRIG